MSGTGLSVVMFLDWFTATDGERGGLDFTADEGHRNAWQAFSSIDVVLAVTVVAAFSLTIFAVRDIRGQGADLFARTVIVLAAISAVLVGSRVGFTPSSFGGLGPNVAVRSTAWAWIGLLACCLLAVGGIMALRASRKEERHL